VKLLHVTPSFYPATYYGGPTYTTYALCNALAARGDIELRVLTTDTAGPHRSQRLPVASFPLRLPAGYDVYFCKRWVGTDISPGQMARLYWMMRWADVVHLTAVYSPPTIPTLFLSKILRKPLVWSPRGALQRWQGSTRTGTKAWWDKTCNRLCSPRRVAMHFTSETEREESQTVITRARAVVVPNGIDLQFGVPPSGGDFEVSPSGDDFEVPPSGGDFEVSPSGDDIPDIPPKGGTPNVVTPNVVTPNGFTRNLHLLYLGRLHPIKGIENLLRALARVDTGVTLSICGEGDIAYRRSLESLVSDLALGDRVRFHGRIEGRAKSPEFARADACVVPSFKENFCVVVAESLAHGVPVIASKGTPWARVEEVGCGLWVDNSPEGLAAAIQRLSGMSLREMGRRGREWMKREFSWAAVAAEMAASYEEVRDQRSEVSQNRRR
jgi:glycosyltransferase involved in cell wall biosynthesis